jgi:chorismate synthase
MATRDYRGGGLCKALEKPSWWWCCQSKCWHQINAYTSSAGDLKLDKITKNLDFSQIEKNVVRCADAASRKREDKIMQVRNMIP